MSKAIIDVGELHRFVSTFGALCGHLREQKDFMNAKFAELHEVWRDTRYDKFDQNFTETVKEIDKFLRHAELYTEYLDRKARKAQEYLDGY